MDVAQAKPRILVLADKRNWAFDHEARELKRTLGVEFEIDIAYVAERPDLSERRFDCVVVLLWWETYHLRFVHDPRKVIKQVASHRWAFEPYFGLLTPKQFVDAHLWDAATVVCVSKRLRAELSPYREVLHVVQGVDTVSLRRAEPRRGPLVFGWAGRTAAIDKGLKEILRPAAGCDFDLRIAGGELGWDEMIRFYHSIDVICVASKHEGEPRTLIEGMVAGCFPVATDVGIVPELVTHRSNGLIVRRSVAASRAAFQWCCLNPEAVRVAGIENGRRTSESREGTKTSATWRVALRRALALQGAGRIAACGSAGPEDRG